MYFRINTRKHVAVVSAVALGLWMFHLQTQLIKNHTNKMKTMNLRSMNAKMTEQLTLLRSMNTNPRQKIDTKTNDHPSTESKAPVQLPDGYDVLDVGSSKGGGSITFLASAVSKLRFIDADTVERLDARELGLDYDQTKVDTCNAVEKDTRNDCRLFNILSDTESDLSDIGTRTISGNSYWHVLEHIPECDMAEEMWVKAAAFSKRFSSFHGPAYDNEMTATGEEPTGVHRFWENWSGHTCHFDSAMMERAIRAVPKTTAFVVINFGKMSTTDHDIFVPADTPENSHHYDPETMSARDIEPLDPPLYEEMRACAIYDEDPEEHMSLYAALCLLDAFRLPHKLFQMDQQIVVCSVPGAEVDDDECATTLKAIAESTIRRFEQLHTDDVLLSI